MWIAKKMPLIVLKWVLIRHSRFPVVCFSVTYKKKSDPFKFQWVCLFFIELSPTNWILYSQFNKSSVNVWISNKPIGCKILECQRFLRQSGNWYVSFTIEMMIFFRLIMHTECVTLLIVSGVAKSDFVSVQSNLRHTWIESWTVPKKK